MTVTIFGLGFIGIEKYRNLIVEGNYDKLKELLFLANEIKYVI